MVSQKISQFDVSTSLNNSDLFTFVVNGTNKSISYSSFKTDLGVTGSLSQVGDPLGAPVLFQNGTDYGIRNLESGSGVIASVSAQNGVVLKHNFAFNSDGIPLSDNPNLLQPVFRSLVAGEGISISGVGDEIIISESALATSTKTVLVTVEADFGELSGGAYTLKSDTDYLIVNDISTVNRFIVEPDCQIRGVGTVIIALEYTGAGVMFTVNDPNFRLFNCTFRCLSGTFMQSTDTTGLGVISANRLNVFCANFGTLTDVRFFALSNVSLVTTVTGVNFAGTGEALSIMSFFDC